MGKIKKVNTIPVLGYNFEVRYKKKLKDTNVKIYVRRGGPNYQEGLRIMKELGKEIGIPIDVYGPETHMTRIVNMALKGKN